MFKRSVSLLVIVFVLLIGVTSAIAGSGGNARKGKYLFRKNCRTCHAPGKEASDLSPVSKTQAEWVKAFAPEAAAAYPCKDKWDSLKEKDIKDIFAYLHDHASDSPSPAKCK